MPGRVNSSLRPPRGPGFLRADGDSAVLALLDRSDRAAAVSVAGRRHHGRFTNLFAEGAPVGVDAGTRWELPPWGFRVLWR